MTQLILYTPQKSERLRYAVDFTFKTVLGVQCAITDSRQEFLASSRFKINYSNQFITAADLQIVPQGILFAKDIVPQQIRMETWHKLPCFFMTSDSEVGFDLFAGVFYLISRYEEYLPYTPDLYQRFPESESLALKQNFLKIPLVDLWIREFQKVLLEKCAHLNFQSGPSQFIPTYDIDIAYSYAGKGFLRNAGGLLKDLFARNWKGFRERERVLLNKEPDPYDSYSFLDALHDKYNLKPIYFFLAGKNGPLDKNLPFEGRKMKQLFEIVSQKYSVGIHPSYQSHEDVQILRNEVNKMNTLKSRQHYIRFQLPVTFRNLHNAGIREDYSMGYGSINGFRASTSFPFFWFDVQHNELTGLKLFPFCFMECNSFFEQHYSAGQALEEMRYYYLQVENVGGTFISIWHNFSLGTDSRWKGWKEIYQKFIEEIYLDISLKK